MVYCYSWPCKLFDNFYLGAASTFKHNLYLPVCSVLFHVASFKSVLWWGERSMNLSLEEFDLTVPMLLQKYKFLTHLFSFFSSHLVIFHYFCCISSDIDSAVYCSISCNFYTLVTPDMRGWDIPFVSVGGRNHSFGRREESKEAVEKEIFGTKFTQKETCSIFKK